MSIIVNSFYQLIEALINSGAFTDSSEEEKMKKLGFATGSEVRKNAFTAYYLLQIQNCNITSQFRVLL